MIVYIVAVAALILGFISGIVFWMFIVGDSTDQEKRASQTTQRQPSQMPIGLSRDDYAKCPDCGAGPFTRCSPGCHIAAQVEAALATVKS